MQLHTLLPQCLHWATLCRCLHAVLLPGMSRVCLQAFPRGASTRFPPSTPGVISSPAWGLFVCRWFSLWVSLCAGFCLKAGDAWASCVRVYCCRAVSRRSAQPKCALPNCSVLSACAGCFWFSCVHAGLFGVIVPHAARQRMVSCLSEIRFWELGFLTVGILLVERRITGRDTSYFAMPFTRIRRRMSPNSATPSWVSPCASHSGSIFLRSLGFRC